MALVKPAKPAILSLPDELLVAVFNLIADDTILLVPRTCRRFFHVSTLILWRDRCLKYEFWSPHHEFENMLQQLPPSHPQFKALFHIRLMTDRRVTRILNEIINTSTNRIPKFEQIASEGYDAKDTLKTHLEVDDSADDVLARRYFANEALGVIHRRRAIELLRIMTAGANPGLEVVMGAFELFIATGATRDIKQIGRSLDALVIQFRTAYPLESTLSAKERASLLILWMHQNGFMCLQPDEVTSVRHSFISICIDSCRSTTPITLVILFCLLATRIGLVAKPCAPYRPFSEFLAIVIDGEDTPENYSFWQPSRTHEEIPRKELEIFLRNSFIDPANALIPLSTRSLVAIIGVYITLTSNIVRSPSLTLVIDEINKPQVTSDGHAPMYAALVASFMLGGAHTAGSLDRLCEVMHESFAVDVGFFEDVMPQLISEDDSMMLHNICNAVRAEDRTPKRAWWRTTQRSIHGADRVRYRVGTLFRHRRYNLRAVITGWTCHSSPSHHHPTPNPNSSSTNSTHFPSITSIADPTITTAPSNVFYTVFVNDGSSRYVAEDNVVELVGEELEAAAKFFGRFVALGKYFKRYDATIGRFRSNIRHEFPED